MVPVVVGYSCMVYSVVILSTNLLTSMGMFVSVLFRNTLYSLVTLKLFSPSSMLKVLLELGPP